MKCLVNWIKIIRMRIETREAMEMLFSAKWNLPQAAKHCRLTHKEMKITLKTLKLLRIICVMQRMKQ